MYFHSTSSYKTFMLLHLWWVTFYSVGLLEFKDNEDGKKHNALSSQVIPPKMLTWFLHRPSSWLIANFSLKNRFSFLTKPSRSKPIGLLKIRLCKGNFVFLYDSGLFLLDWSGLEQAWQMGAVIPFASCVSHVSSHLWHWWNAPCFSPQPVVTKGTNSDFYGFIHRVYFNPQSCSRQPTAVGYRRSRLLRNEKQA